MYIRYNCIKIQGINENKTCIKIIFDSLFYLKFLWVKKIKTIIKLIMSKFQQRFSAKLTQFKVLFFILLINGNSLIKYL